MYEIFNPAGSVLKSAPRQADGVPSGNTGSSALTCTKTCNAESSPNACDKMSLSSLLDEILYTNGRYLSVTDFQSTPCKLGS